jgi:non-canonical purine NTP pyrophosphatase (RdgB/HAM1 family)
MCSTVSGGAPAPAGAADLQAAGAAARDLRAADALTLPPDARVLCLSTGNAHKLEEFQAMLGPLGLSVIAPATPLEVEEDGETFAANALKKATALMEITGHSALADDSGLEVAALDGAPGVRSARYADTAPAAAGAGDTDARNRTKLLLALADVPQPQRQARFVCAIAYCQPHAKAQLFEGTVSGSIAAAARGTGGFGYDSIFIPQGYTETFASLGAAVKNRISHRAMALRHLVKALQP